uniref:Uncharacterized protein n=1 Tax=Hyaloperonospora arabidopsidis (strain Emoy2) TaxID=559515 RepID=M4B6A5_HYAAE
MVMGTTHLALYAIEVLSIHCPRFYRLFASIAATRKKALTWRDRASSWYNKKKERERQRERERDRRSSSMSREERKMAQIIASIERMEQEARASGDDATRVQEQPEWVKQGARGKKGRQRGRVLSVKVKTTEKKGKNGAGADARGAGGATQPFVECKLTPKKRWIQLWSAQQDGRDDRNRNLEGVDCRAGEDGDTTAAPVGIDVSVAERSSMETLDAETKESRQREEEIVDVPTAAVDAVVSTCKEEELASDVVSVDATKCKLQELSAAGPMEMGVAVVERDDVAAVAVATSSELRVKTPINNESSHLSPPLERSSPAVAASISPSAKVMDSDATNSSNMAAAAATAAELERRVVTDQEEGVPEQKMAAPSLERKRSSSSSACEDDDSYRSEVSYGCGRKRSLENGESPVSDEAKRRAERRRKRKSNWDVGDPRKGETPVADLPASAAAAAANQQSFDKYPSTGPSWRHSPGTMDVKPPPPPYPQSMVMDMKPAFQSGHRPSTFFNKVSSAGGRRGFYHTPDRSRSAGRSSLRFSYGNSGSNYR